MYWWLTFSHDVYWRCTRHTHTLPPTPIQGHPFTLVCFSFPHYLGFNCLVLTLKCFQHLAFWMVNLHCVGPILEGNFRLKNVILWIFLSPHMLNTLLSPPWFALLKSFDMAHQSWLLCSKQVPVKTKSVYPGTQARPAEFKGYYLNPSVYFAFKKNANTIIRLSLYFIIFIVFMLQMPPPPPRFPSHKNISPNDLLGHLIPLCSEKPLFKYLAVWDSCQLNTNETERRRLITGVLLITLHLTYFSLATRGHKKKTILFKTTGRLCYARCNYVPHRKWW